MPAQATGSLSLRRRPSLSPEQERELFRRLQRGDEDAFQQIIEANLPFVIAVAREYDTRSLTHDELVSEGSMGLIEAARRFDPSRGNRFITYAVWWIRNAIRAALDQAGLALRAPTNLGPDQRRLHATARSLGHRLGRQPTDDEVDRGSGLSPSRADHARRRAGADLSLDVPFEDGRCLADLVAADAVPVDDAVAADQRRRDVCRALGRLPERERHVLRACFGFDRQEPASLQAIGRVLGVTRERARQIKESGLARLRAVALEDLAGWGEETPTTFAGRGGVRSVG